MVQRAKKLNSLLDCRLDPFRGLGATLKIAIAVVAAEIVEAMMITAAVFLLLVGFACAKALLAAKVS